ncbi:MAG: hypothetical protein KBT27_11190 [Prevotellaceae bacterium]|nr:hypothetical protein [Candidatus Faecinaster equi]
MRKFICKIFNLIPKEEYDALVEAYDVAVEIKNEVIFNQSVELGEARGTIVRQECEINQLENENHHLSNMLKKYDTRPYTCVAIAYGSLLPSGYTDEMLKKAAWNKLLGKIEDVGVQYDFRDGECVATIEVLI